MESATLTGLREIWAEIRREDATATCRECLWRRICNRIERADGDDATCVAAARGRE